MEHFEGGASSRKAGSGRERAIAGPIAECRQDEVQGRLEKLLGPYARETNANTIFGPKLGLTRVEDSTAMPSADAAGRAADAEAAAGRKHKKKKISRAQTAEADAASRWLKGFKCTDALGDPQGWRRAMVEATTLLRHSHSAERLPLSLRHELPPLQHGATWDHGDVVLPGAKYAARAQALREVQEPPVTPLLVPPPHMRALLNLMQGPDELVAPS